MVLCLINLGLLALGRFFRELMILQVCRIGMDVWLVSLLYTLLFARYIDKTELMLLFMNVMDLDVVEFINTFLVGSFS